MYFFDGYKYQLAIPVLFQTSFRPLREISIARITLSTDGLMKVHDGYAWDGASGVIDSKTNIKASCGHDALYQLMRMKKLPHSEWPSADEDFCVWLKEAGAWDITVNLARWGLKQMNGKYAHPNQRKPILTA